jgi:hypothetical protein
MIKFLKGDLLKSEAGQQPIKPEVYLAAVRLSEFLKQFQQFTPDEKKALIERVDELNAYGLVEFNEFMQKWLGNNII